MVNLEMVSSRDQSKCLIEVDESLLPDLEKVRAFADSIGKRADFERALGQVVFPTFFGQTAKTRLYHDFAEHSFGFSVYALTKTGEWRFAMNGGLIFHQSSQDWGVHT